MRQEIQLGRWCIYKKWDQNGDVELCGNGAWNTTGLGET